MRTSFDPSADKNCEDLLNQALQTDPGNTEALQALASVRLSQQRPDDAKICLEQAWSQWKDLDLGLTFFIPYIPDEMTFKSYQMTRDYHLYRPASRS